MIPDRDIPGFAESVARENFQRDLAFNPDAPEFVAGVAVRPLTLRHLQIIRAVNSPFFYGRPPAPEDCAVFLWIVSPRFRPLKTWRDKLARLMFVRGLRRLKFGPCIDDIRRYLDDAFADSPPDSGGNGKSYWSLSASMIDLFRREYQWSQEYTLEQPLKALFQLQNIIRRRNNPSACLFNRSDKIAREHRRKMRKEKADGI